MLRYELKKILIYQKSWIVLFILFLSFFLTAYQNNVQELATSFYQQEYYNQLQGQNVFEIQEYLELEKENMDNISIVIMTTLEDYQAGIINQDEYIERMEQQNEYQYKYDAFSQVQEYYQYLQDDYLRTYIYEANIENYFTQDFPLLLIIVCIWISVTTFYNEKEMVPLINTSKIGRIKLVKTKIISLSILFLLTIVVYHSINLLFCYDWQYSNDLFAVVSSSMFFQDSFYNGTFLSLLLLLALMQYIAVIILVFITLLLFYILRIRIIPFIIILLMSYLLPIFTFSLDVLYYIVPIGFFNPVMYYLESLKGVEVLGMILVVSVILALFVSKKIKIIPIFVVLLMLSGCSNQMINDSDVSYTNDDTYSYNQDVAIIYNQIYNFHEDAYYSLNRDVTKNLESTGIGYMQNQLYYYVANLEDEVVLVCLDTSSYNQEIIYTFDYYGIGSINYITSIKVYGDDYYIRYYDRIEKIANGKASVYIDGSANIIGWINENVYFINDVNQLIKMDQEGNQEVVLQELVSLVRIVDNTLYYVSLQNEFLYSYDFETKETQLLIQQKINDFEIYDNYIYYVTLEENGITKVKLEDNSQEYLLQDREVYFITIYEGIFFGAKISNSNQIGFYYTNFDMKECIEINYK
ncbi:DUF5050 domain-containing protein [Tannockella kyphosi]|uniref:DUF5050 domain-containing protein n=1 Tax=Tannockella kyphosi TaxID=2899121 RepID=UPI00201258C1|nr:DUF5050 domain-containing protein [Tannockella kyphosi]